MEPPYFSFWEMLEVSPLLLKKSFSASPRLIHYLVLYLTIIVASIPIAISLKSDLGITPTDFTNSWSKRNIPRAKNNNCVCSPHPLFRSKR
ncbi:MAG: hypothetical protein MGF17_00965 [Trichodesmium sp. MAG_R04]|nr:hypothetical protein [Trichodesmium sp. MAG_R04]